MKPAYFGQGTHSGVDITFTRSTLTVSVGGWYDSFVGIESEVLSLREFLERIGIHERDVRKALEVRE